LSCCVRTGKQYDHKKKKGLWQPQTIIIEATNRVSVRSIVDVHVGIAAIEVEVASIRAANRTTPIVAVGTDIVERTIAVVAVACQRQ